MIRVITLIIIIVICLCLYYKLYKKQESFQVENTYMKLFRNLITLNQNELTESEIKKISLRLNKFFSNL